MYDPDMDDEDEKWVIKQRRDHRQKGMMSVNLTMENWFELNNVIVYSSYYWMMYVMSIISVYMVLFYWENSRQLGIIKLLPDCSINLWLDWILTAKPAATFTLLFYQAEDNGTNKLFEPISVYQNKFFDGQEWYTYRIYLLVTSQHVYLTGQN